MTNAILAGVVMIGIPVVPFDSFSLPATNQETVCESVVDSCHSTTDLELDGSYNLQDIEDANISLATALIPPKPAPVLAAVRRVVRPAPEDLMGLFVEAQNIYGVPADKLVTIARCESGFRPDAIGGGGLYWGLFQFVSGTWVSNRNAMGADPDPNLRLNAREAIMTAAFKMSRDGYGAWPVCGKK